MQRTASHGLRTAMRVQGARRMAIQATVKKATDDSAVDYPAPSHVNVQAEAMSIARQFNKFYSSADSKVTLSDEARAALADEIAKKVAAIPDSELDDAWVRTNLAPPKTIKVGDNPLFGK